MYATPALLLAQNQVTPLVGAAQLQDRLGMVLPRAAAAAPGSRLGLPASCAELFLLQQFDQLFPSHLLKLGM